MPTVDLALTCPGVVENEDFLVFYVESSRLGQEAHRVDLSHYRGNGSCDCEDFQIAKRALFKGERLSKRQCLERGQIPLPSLECKHIKSAKRFLCFRLLNHMIEKREKATKKVSPVGSGVSRPIQKIERRDSWETRPDLPH